MNNITTANLETERKWVIAIYILQLIGYFSVLPLIAAIIFNYIREGNCHGTYLQSHHRWQMRTFWYGLLWFIIGAVTAIIVVGIFIIIVNYVWLLYRVIKGLILASEHASVNAYKRA